MISLCSLVPPPQIPFFGFSSAPRPPQVAGWVGQHVESAEANIDSVEPWVGVAWADAGLLLTCLSTRSTALYFGWQIRPLLLNSFLRPIFFLNQGCDTLQELIFILVCKFKLYFKNSVFKYRRVPQGCGQIQRIIDETAVCKWKARD